MSNLKKVTDQNFKAEVLDSTSPVLVDFWAAWCGPCRMMAPVIEALAEKFSPDIKVMKLNTDDNQQTAHDYNIQGIPTLILYENGQEMKRIVGFKQQSELEQVLNEYKK